MGQESGGIEGERQRESKGVEGRGEGSGREEMDVRGKRLIRCSDPNS